ncbi:Endoribonuclease Dicer [Desmophyllum pertusum]|uniref:Endoribonuclease Dicer n=1 Tax=Desmophyllum pertusum TaxID=174260 RepID=A0A9W9Z7T4_9CNID|nr:Endoribonuclease Dicer [Desmophyllum pertusum]
MPPGELTDLRSAVVNNYSFAVLAVQLGFPKHLRSSSPQLFSIVNKFAEKLKEKEMKQQQVKSDEIYSSVFVMRSEGDEDAVQVEVPKALGDLFEAVAVQCMWTVVKTWTGCGKCICLSSSLLLVNYYSAHPPMSAIRKLLEMMPNAAKFSPVERMVDGKFKCTLTVSGCGTFVATGRNFRIAKSTTAQRALNALQQREVRTRGDNT